MLWTLGRTTARESAQTTTPVPWLSDEVWQSLPPAARLRRGAVAQPTLAVATTDDRKRAPVGKAATPLPPRGSLPQLAHMLRGTPGRGRINTPTWPVCCERLATLVALHGGREQLAQLESATAPLDRAYLDAEFDSWGPGAKEKGWSEVLALIRAGEHTGEGVSLFHCRACGRYYVASCGPR